MEDKFCQYLPTHNRRLPLTGPRRYPCYKSLFVEMRKWQCVGCGLIQDRRYCPTGTLSCIWSEIFNRPRLPHARTSRGNQDHPRDYLLGHE